MTDFEHLRELAEKATPGEWEGHSGYLIRACDDEFCAPIAEIRTPFRPGVRLIRGNKEEQANLAFIVAAQPRAILDLLTALDEARAEAARLREAMAVIRDRKARNLLPWTHEQAADEYSRMLDADRTTARQALEVKP